MIAYVVRRFVLGVLLFVTVSYSTFWVLAAHLNALYPLLFQTPRPTAQINKLTGIAHLDDSIPARYWFWVRSIVDGGAGSRTILDQTKIWHPVVQAFARTAELAAGALILSFVAAIAIGVVAAARWGRPTDKLLRMLGYLTWSVPTFVTALVLQAVATRLLTRTGFHVFTPGGEPSGSGFGYVVDWYRHMTFPIVAVALGYIGLYSRYVRSAMLVTLAAPYTTVARAKGLREPGILIRHALRNALVPVVSVVSLDLGAVIGTTLVADIIFGLRGVGGLFFASVRLDDPYLLEAILAITIAAVIVLSFLGDVVLGWLDPRVTID